MSTTMGKEASLDGLEFDGETVLCRVCGDKASGFHYGVHACEGCKGFFRRSIQQKIQYRPCLKNQQCNIMRVNRNRCQYCRLKKCISVGMSRDAVRFGRVPKKEKARIMEQMQRVNSQSVTSALAEILENESDLVQTVINSHKLTNEFTQERVQRLRQDAFHRNDFMTCPAHMACPLNVNVDTDANDNKQRWEDFSEYFTPAIKCVVDFAKAIPGFQLLSQDDQVTLLKAGTFEVLLLRFVSLFDPVTNTMLFTNGKLFKRQPSSVSGTAGFLLDSMFDFTDRFSKLNLTEEELALFSAIILLAPDRPGLRNIDQVERIQNRLTQALQNMINSMHMGDSTLFAKLLMKTTDLRTLNTLHSEKLIGPQSKDGGRTNDLFQVKQEQQVPMETETSGSNEMLLNYGPPSGTNPMAIPGHPMERSNPDLTRAGPTVPVVPQRMNMEGNSHQKLVLQTPYGTFYREEVSGFYGYLPDQPRQRCHTLDRDTMSRPSRSLHVIDEGNRRRYTLDKEYISKMVNKLSHKLEKRAAINDDYNPPSISSSACSSPVPDDHYNLVGSRDFLPMGSTPDSSACSSRTSPVPGGKDRYSPGSPNPRSRSGSMAEKDYSEIRRRCYSFHLNSEGRAARNLHPTAMPMDGDKISLDGVQPAYSADMRRGSVGASYGIHRHEKALLMDRGAHLLQNPDMFYHGLKRLSKEDLSKFQCVEHPVSLIAPTPTKQLSPSPQSVSMSPPALPKVCPMEKVHSPQSDMPKLSWMSQDGNRSIENITPPAQSDAEAGPTSATIAGASNPDTRIVVSDFSSHSSTGVVHKKFDKFRKTVPQSPPSGSVGPAEKDAPKMVCPIEVTRQEPMSTGNQSLRVGSPPDVEKVSKPSAAQAHPQLMAHLQAPPPAMVQPFTQVATSPPLLTRPAQLTTEPQVVMVTAHPKPVAASSNNSSISNLLLGSSAQQNCSRQLSQSEEKNIRNHVHATTMSSLKDKLLKKMDSMDNLMKIGNGNGANIPAAEQNGSAPQQRDSLKLAPGPMISLGAPPTSVMTTQPPHTMYVPSPIYSRQMPVYPPYYGLRYPAVPGMAVLPQAPYGQALPSMQHLTQMYNGPMPGPHSRPGQPLNLTKRLEDMSQMVSGPRILTVPENGIKSNAQGPQLLVKEEPAA